jgi:hypothetical protein
MHCKKANEVIFTVRKVTDNHWGLVYKGCPARSTTGQIFRFQTENEAKDMAKKLNEREHQMSTVSLSWSRRLAEGRSDAGAARTMPPLGKL